MSANETIRVRVRDGVYVIPMNQLQAAVDYALKQAKESGEFGEGGSASVEMRVSGGYIQYSTDGTVWNNVISLSELKGEPGVPGNDYVLTDSDIDEIAEIVANKIDTSGFATSEQLKEVSGTKLDKMQGVDNVGRLLYVGEDGGVVPIALGDGLCVKTLTGKNIFSGEGEWKNGYWTTNTGEWRDMDTGKTWASVQKKFPVESGATYAASITGYPAAPYVAFAVAQYDADGGFISAADAGVFRPTITKDITFAVGADTAYIGINLYSQDQPWEDMVPVGLMIEKGTVSTEYEPFIDDTMAKATLHTTAELSGGFDPADYEPPVLYLDGDASGMTKENAVELEYVFRGVRGTASVKWQGSSSLSYPKKNYTIKFDNAFEAAEGWGAQKKYCTKANYIDFSHSRNVVTAKLWGQMVDSRTAEMDVAEKTIVLTDSDIAGAGYISGHPNDAGQLVPNDWWYATKEIPLDFAAGHPITAHCTIYGNGGMAFYDAGGNYLLSVCGGYGAEEYGITPSDSMQEVVITPPEKAAYIRLSAFKNSSYTGPEDFWVKGSVNTGVTAKLQACPNGGAVDGFPVSIVLNGEYQGVYTFNIPKDGWMMNMGNGTNECILCAEYSDASAFKGEATLDGDFDIEYIPDENSTDWARDSLNNLINACIASDGTDLDTTIAAMLDWDSAIDYYILVALINGFDMVGKNYLISTYDGVKWFFGAYDMDSTYGLWWTGEKFLSAKGQYTFATGSTMHRVFNLIYLYKKDALKARYKKLRSTVMSEDNVALMFRNFAGSIPRPLLEEDNRKWTHIPNTSTNTVQQVIDWYRLRCAEIDAEVDAM